MRWTAPRQRHRNVPIRESDSLSEAEIDGLYTDEAMHRTEPFTTPQVAPANP